MDGHAVWPATQCSSLRLPLVIDTLVSKLPNAIELYLSSVPPDDPVRFLSRSP
jgi:hypothetical protein